MAVALAVGVDATRTRRRTVPRPPRHQHRTAHRRAPLHTARHPYRATPALHAKSMLLCVSSRELVEVLLVALGELAVVAQASFEG